MERQAQAPSLTGSANTGNQLYRQRKHRQPLIQATEAQATSYTGNPGTKHTLPLVQAALAQATIYTYSPSTWQPVEHAAQEPITIKNEL